MTTLEWSTIGLVVCALIWAAGYTLWLDRSAAAHPHDEDQESVMARYRIVPHPSWNTTGQYVVQARRSRPASWGRQGSCWESIGMSEDRDTLRRIAAKDSQITVYPPPPEVEYIP